MSVPTSSPSPWLVVIDMQTAFADPTSEWAVPAYPEIVPVISSLVDAFGERVVHTRFVPDEAEPGQWSRYYDRWSTMRQPASSQLWDLTVPVPPGTPVVSRPTFSKWHPELVRFLNTDAPLVMCGVATDCCVLATALAAADDGRGVTVVADACGGATSRHHDQALSLLALLDPLVAVTTSEQLLGAAEEG